MTHMTMLKQSAMPSRIPVRSKKSSAHSRTVSAPSKLERLAAEYQQKLLREKERKLIALHQEQENRALQRVQNYQNDARNPAARDGYGSAGSNVPNQQNRQQPKGMLREFFQERRALENDPNGNNYHHSNINYHYKQKRAAYENSATYTPPNSNGNRRAPKGKPPLPLVKNTTGRDKAHPLEPLEKSSKHHQRRHSDSPISNGHAFNHSPKPPFESKPQLVRQHRRGSVSGYSSGSDKANSPIPDIYNLPAEKAIIPINKKTQKVKKSLKPIQTNPPSSDDDSSTPGSSAKRRSKFQQWQDEMDQKRNERNNRVKKSQHVPQPPQAANKPKLSDFQKWQMEQDKNREERLQKYSQQRQPESPAPFSDSDTYSSRTQPSQRTLEPISNRSKARSPKVPNSTRVVSPQKDDTVRKQKDSILKNSKPPTGKKAISSMTEDELVLEIRRKEALLQAMLEEHQKNNKEQKAKKSQKESERQKMKEQQRKIEEAEELERVQSQSTQAYSRQDYQDIHGRISRRRNSSLHSSPESPMIAPSPKPKKQVKKAKPQPLPPRRSPAVRQSTPDNENTAFYLEMAATNGAVENVDLAECPTCGRKFASERLAKHANICTKAASKKPRKVFNPVEMRTQGTDHAKYAKEAEKAKKQKKPPKSNWRTQHENFVKSIRYAKKVSDVEAKGGDLSQLPPPPVTENPDYKQCPYCSRKFNPTTAERHIPKCKDIKSRPAPPKQRRR